MVKVVIDREDCISCGAFWESCPPSEEAILKITHPFREIGVPHVAPALPLEDALKMMEKL